MLGSLLGNYLIKQFAVQKTPTVYADKCMNVRQKRQLCTECVTTCPKDALTYQNGIQLNSEKCTNCNLCAAICPSVVFVPLMESLEGMYRTIHENKNISISCKQSDSESLIKVRCICELPWEVLAYAALDQKLTVELSKCNQCVHEKETKLIQSKIQRLQEFLGEDLFEENVSLTFDSKTQMDNRLTRREVFSYMMNQGKKATVMTAPFLFPKNEDARIYRTLLVQKVQKLSTNISREYGWNAVGVNASCYGCKTCEKLCPQKAIKIVDEDEKRYFTHNYAKCTHCGICRTVCNEQAPVLFFDKKDGCRIVTAYEIEANRCNVCKDPIPSSEDGLCIVCRRKQSRRRR